MPATRRPNLLPRILASAATVALLAGVPSRADDFSHGASTVRVVDIPSKTSSDEIEDQKLELLHDGKPIANYSVSGYIRDAYWSPDGKWVAINLRHANSGDYMWVLDAATGKAVRQPSDETDDPWQTAAYAAFAKKNPKATDDTMMHYWKFAKGWTPDGKLLAVVRADYAEGAGRFDYTIPMTVTPDGIAPDEAKLTHQSLE